LTELHAIIRRMYGKNLSTIRTFCHDDAYKLRVSRRSFREKKKRRLSLYMLW